MNNCCTMKKIVKIVHGVKSKLWSYALGHVLDLHVGEHISLDHVTVHVLMLCHFHSGGASLVPMILPSGCRIKESLEASSSILQSVIAGDWQQSAGPKTNLITRKEHSGKDKGVFSPGDLQQTVGPTVNPVIREEQYKDYIGDYSPFFTIWWH